MNADVPAAPMGDGKLALLLGTLTAFASLSIDMYLPSLPSIERDLHTTSGRVQLTLAAFFAGLAIGQALYGPLSDRFGRRRPLLFGLVLYIVGSLGCALAPSIGTLIALRFVQAVGGAAGIVIARAVVRDVRSGADAARMFSLLVLVMGIAPILAPSIGGALLLFGTWRITFAVLAVIGLVVLAVVPRALPETSTGRLARLDLASLGDNVRALGRDRDFVAYAFTGAFSQSGLFAYIVGSPFVLIGLFHVSPQTYAWLFSANAAGLIAASQINRRLLVTRAPVAVLARALVVALVAAAAYVLLAVLRVSSLPSVVVCLFAFVATLGFAGPNATAVALEGQAARAGLASAVLGSGQYIIAALAAGAVSAANDGTMLPMAAVMMACAIAALVSAALGRRASALAASARV